MDKDLEVFKEMIDNEIEVSHDMQADKAVGNVFYLISSEGSHIWNTVTDEIIEDFTDTVYDLIQERMDADEESYRDEVEHQRHLNNTYR